MKTSKPLRLGVLIRPYELARKVHAVVTLFAPFRLDDPKHLITDMEMWLEAQASLGEQAVLDEGLAKVSGEVMIAGSCFPQGAPQTVSFARVTVTRGDDKPMVDKRVAVFGDRRWKGGVPTAPEPFSEMPLTWERAFGGEKFEKNPKGRGANPSGEGEQRVHRLPNLERPDKLIKSPSDAPNASTFLPFDPTWPQRMGKQGRNYDDKWMRERYPGPADDLDPTFYHLADEDQRIEAYFEGGERFAIENMHPEHARIEGVLPTLVGRAFIARRPADLKLPRRGRPKPEKLEEIRTRIDTVWFFPKAMLGVLVFRGTTPALDDDLGDIEQLMIALDDPREVRPLSHFEAALAARLDEDDGAIRGLDDEDLLPSAALGYSVSFPDFELETKLKPQGYVRDNQMKRAELLEAPLRAELIEKGLDPIAYGLGPVVEPEVPSYREPKKLAPFIREQFAKAKAERASAEARGAELEEKARAFAKEHGRDWDEMKKAAIREMGPPKLVVRATFAETEARVTERESEGISLPELRSMVDDEAMIAKLERLEQLHIEQYRKIAQFDDEVRPPPEDVLLARRAQVEFARDAGESLAGTDLSGADLSKMDLSGVDLTGAFLEGANLAGTKLVKAKLDRAVLARTDLTDADLSGASLIETNLGAAQIVRTSLAGCDAKGAHFDRATIREARFTGVNLEGASFIETTMVRPDLSFVTGHQVVFIKLDLSGAKLNGAKLTKTMFCEVRLDGASFDDADMPNTQLLACSAKGLTARRAKLTSSFIGHGSSLEGAILDDADLSLTSFRTTSLVRASLRGAKLVQADFSECDASEACFERASAQKALFMRTILRGAKLRGANLMEALLGKADLAECDLSDTNMFRADLARVHLSGGTKIDRALLEFARVEPKEEKASP